MLIAPVADMRDYAAAVLLAGGLLFGVCAAVGQPAGGSGAAAAEVEAQALSAVVEGSPGGRAARALMERLRRDIQLLNGLIKAQKALLAWNVARVNVGAAPVVLPEDLCMSDEMKSWCVLLPTTFTGRRWEER